jgi:hypothetical protein
MSPAFPGSEILYFSPAKILFFAIPRYSQDDSKLNKSLFNKIYKPLLSEVVSFHITTGIPL